MTEFSVPVTRPVRPADGDVHRNDDGTYRRDDERHDNVMVDVSTVPALLAEHGVEAEVRDAFGDEALPLGLKVIVGRKTR